MSGLTFNVPVTAAGAAFARGVKKHGHTATQRKADVLIADYSVVPGERLNREVLEQRERGGRTIFISPGFYQRDQFYAVGWNGVGGRGDYCNSDCDSERRLQHGTNIKPWRQGGEAVVVCGQVPTDPSVLHIDIYQWLRQTVRAMPEYTQRPIIVRPHPLSSGFVPDVGGAEVSTHPLPHDIKRAHVLVTFSSGTSGMAVLEGVPVVAVDKGSIAWDVAAHNLGGIEAPQRPPDDAREGWADRLAYAQWTLEEIACGMVWERLRAGV